MRACLVVMLAFGVGASVDEVRALVVGPQGTLVRIQFERVTTGSTFECSLLRGTSAPSVCVHAQCILQPRPRSTTFGFS